MLWMGGIFGYKVCSMFCRSLQRRYARVDRLKLKDKLLQQCSDYEVQFHLGRARSCTHNDRGSALVCMDGTVISGTVVVDATGHARKLTSMDGEHKPGYQAAYGVMAGACTDCIHLTLTICTVPSNFPDILLLEDLRMA